LIFCQLIRYSFYCFCFHYFPYFLIVTSFALASFCSFFSQKQVISSSDFIMCFMCKFRCRHFFFTTKVEGGISLFHDFVAKFTTLLFSNEVCQCENIAFVIETHKERFSSKSRRIEFDVERLLLYSLFML